MVVVTPASEGGDKRKASQQIATTVACRKEAQLDLPRAVSEEGLPGIEDLDDEGRMSITSMPNVRSCTLR